jgi:pyruvate/2-oxoglutarate dehydrogenase complex dihydrolipoamide acyltransferase (E2) component
MNTKTRFCRVAMSFLTASLAIGALACSGGGEATSPAQSPTGAAPTAAPKASTATSASPASEPAPQASATESSTPTAPPSLTETSSLTRSVKDIVTAPTVAFQFNFNSSEINDVTENRCNKESNGDPKANADCMQAARNKQAIHVHRFTEKNGTWFWSTYERRGNQMVLLHKFAFEFGEETKNTLEIKPIGKDLGLAPGPTPRSLLIKCSNEFSMELTDPKLGRMVFDAKMGLIPD